jgi:hypothetical protein
MPPIARNHIKSVEKGFCVKVDTNLTVQRFLLIMLGLILANTLKGTEQKKDLLIIEADTFFFEFSPLYGTGLDQQHRDTTCLSTGLYRGYWAHWTLENDSLFLIKVISGSYICSDSSISKHVVFNERLFASWHTGKVKVPLGEKIYCYMCIYPLYKAHNVITFKNGVVKSEIVKSNSKNVEYYDLLDKAQKIELSLIDTLGTFFSTQIKSSKWNRFDCDFSYILHLTSQGHLKFIKLEYDYDLTTEEKKCLRMLKRALNNFDFTIYQLPQQDFTVALDIFYYEDTFEIDRCWRCPLQPR